MVGCVAADILMVIMVSGYWSGVGWFERERERERHLLVYRFYNSDHLLLHLSRGWTHAVVLAEDALPRNIM